MLTSTALTFGRAEQDAEAFEHLVLAGAAADVEEVGGLAAVVLDQVHRAHGQAGAVDQAGDVAVEADVAQAALAGPELGGVFLGHVEHRGDVGVALAAPGGDADGGFARHLNPFNRKRKPPVAYWSGVVDVGPGGRELRYTVPDYFNGRLRIVAIAVEPDSAWAWRKPPPR